MTVEELMLYERLDNEIYERVEEICIHCLDLFNKCSIVVNLYGGYVAMSVRDHENDEIDDLQIPYSSFASREYLLLAKQIRQEDVRQRKLAKKKAREKEKEYKKEERRKLYERLKKGIEGINMEDA